MVAGLVAGVVGDGKLWPPGVLTVCAGILLPALLLGKDLEGTEGTDDTAGTEGTDDMAGADGEEGTDTFVPLLCNLLESSSDGG